MKAAYEGSDCDDDATASSFEGSYSDYGSRLRLTLGFGKFPPLPLDCEESSASSSSSSSTLLNRAEAPAAPSSVPASTAPGSQVVGWPPIKSSRMNAVINHAKPPHLNDDKFGDVDAKSYINCGACNKDDGVITKEGSHITQRACPRKSVYVKVNMDGFPIGRKINLTAHQGYESLANALDSMFSGSMTGVESTRKTRLSKLLDGSSGYVLAYADKEEDLLLVGDVPWGLFLNTVKRLRIMRASAANGFGI